MGKPFIQFRRVQGSGDGEVADARARRVIAAPVVSMGAAVFGLGSVDGFGVQRIA